MKSYVKDPDASLDYPFDWSAYLTPINDTIQSVSWIAEPGLTLGATSHTTTSATAFGSGGVLDTAPMLTCRITTVGGRTDDWSIILKIVNR